MKQPRPSPTPCPRGKSKPSLTPYRIPRAGQMGRVWASERCVPTTWPQLFCKSSLPHAAAGCVSTSRGSSFQTLCATTILPRISSNVGVSRPICCLWHRACFVAPTFIELVRFPRAHSPQPRACHDNDGLPSTSDTGASCAEINFIGGEKGTGKGSILAAIALGLGSGVEATGWVIVIIAIATPATRGRQGFEPAAGSPNPCNFYLLRTLLFSMAYCPS